MANAADFHLLVLLTSNMDGNDKNFMFGRDAQTQAAPNPRFFFAPWTTTPPSAATGRPRESVRQPGVNHLLDRLLANRAYREQFAARWRQLRARGFFTATLERLIDENVRTLGLSGCAAQRRPLDQPADRYPDSLTFDQDVRQMKEWVAARTRWLDGEISRRCSAQTQAR